MNHNQKWGSWGEERARSYLKRKGYKILHSNWHCQWGEIDLVAMKEERLIFFEIKTRQFGVMETVSPGKIKRLSRSIQFYIQRYGYSFENFQVDFIGIETGRSSPGLTGGSKLVHLENVLELRI